jgi:hypothetical protein
MINTLCDTYVLGITAQNQKAEIERRGRVQHGTLDNCLLTQTNAQAGYGGPAGAAQLCVRPPFDRPSLVAAPAEFSFASGMSIFSASSKAAGGRVPISAAGAPTLRFPGRFQLRLSEFASAEIASDYTVGSLALTRCAPFCATASSTTSASASAGASPSASSTAFSSSSGNVAHGPTVCSYLSY